ncbi:endonuclease [Lamprobacter modestohalophilus]|uniref:endonuclease n=1 Tax=Lamprobacter modestohalophilus TaxID=1064514 RepID=UPI002ADEC69E|nr:endonuclease [Lamprobacter modestohalophilus]MEA1048379.1 endonuclease [Lamprobacter modestohalophilus]
MISAVSFVPPTVTEQWGPNAQRAVAVAGDIRILVLDIAVDTSTLVLDTGSSLLTEATSDFDWSTLTAWVPQLEQLDGLLPDRDALPHPAPPGQPGDLPKVAGSFSRAKDLLYDRIYRGHRITAYCGCRYNGSRRTDLNSCGMQQYAGDTRADRVEAEHVFPASQFGNFRKCWREPSSFEDCYTSSGKAISGRDCCQRVDVTFTAAHNDLHNLIPAVGLVNGRRSDYNWGMVTSGDRYGDCDIHIDSSIRRVQPPDHLRGDIARIMLYMRDTYGFRLSRQDEQLYTAWNNLDPPDDWEIKCNQRIANLQKITNEYVSAYRKL